MTFEDALREHLESKPKLSGHEKRIMKILDDEPSKRRSRRLKRMEGAAAEVVKTSRAAKGMSTVGGIDWDAASFEGIDWMMILKILIQLLPLLLMIL